MYITYQEYAALGYHSVPADEFRRYEAMARKTVDKYCFQRVTAENITEDNKRGVCEIMDLQYLDANPQFDNENKIISSFSNEGYSETYVQAKQGTAEAVKSAEDKVVGIIALYFTPEQLYRGV